MKNLEGIGLWSYETFVIFFITSILERIENENVGNSDYLIVKHKISHVDKVFPIGPENPVGPLVTPYKYLIKWHNGNSLQKWKKLQVKGQKHPEAKKTKLIKLFGVELLTLVHLH